MFRSFVRAFALIFKELIEVVRQPGLVLLLILGPFLVLFVFGVGYRPLRPPLRTFLVIPEDLGLQRDAAFWNARLEPSARVRSIGTDPAAARQAVEAGSADLAVIVPADVYTAVGEGRYAEITVLHNRLDPVDRGFIGYLSYVLAGELNKAAITEIVREVQSQAGEALRAAGTRLADIPPEVLAAPFQSRVDSVAAYTPDFVAFYTPGVLALMLQHMALTFAALSLVRERLLGTTELYQVAPTSALGVLIGKFVSYAVLSVGVGVALTALSTWQLGVPILGDLRLYWGTLALLVFASIAIGLTISLISTSQEQAVQIAMIMLLASVFFSGFFLSLETLQIPATLVSAVLPVTHAISALQEIMLRGRLQDSGPLYALGGIGLVFAFLSARLLRRELRRQ